MRPKPAQRLRLALRAMATRFEIVLEGEDGGALRAAGEEALSEIADCESRLSRFRRDSLLAHVVRCAGERAVRLDADTFELFALCDAVHHASRGAFDPTVAALMHAHGLADVSARSARTAADAMAHTGWESGVRLDSAARSVALTRRGLALDLGGVAKGHALDLAARVLREAGVERALLHGGTSTVLALAPPQGEEGWWVALGAEADAPRVLLVESALSVSAHCGRRLPSGATHVLDPRTGRSPTAVARSAVLCATATGTDAAARADAWSTAILVAPEPPRESSAHPLEALVMVEQDASRESPRWRALTPLTAIRLPPTLRFSA
jgi:thiamine biosynthesis lipoprotein